jgi:AcrR family transcriptional regulator
MLDAFVEVVGTVGYQRARITDICRRARVSNRAFYATFSDKADCFVVAFDARAWTLAVQAKQAYDTAGGAWEDRVEAGLEVIVSQLAADPSWARFCTLEAARLEPSTAARVRAVVHRCEQLFEHDVRLQSPPSLPGGALGSLLSGAVTRPIHSYVDGGKIDRLPELVPEIVCFVTLVTAGRGRPAGRSAAGP